MGLNSNKERKAWWEEMKATYPIEEIKKAMATLAPDTRQVIQLHYEQQIPLKEIIPILKRTITIVRNHQCRGIFKLHRYFNSTESETPSAKR